MRASVAPDRALADSEAQLAFAVEACTLGLFEWDVATGRLSWSHGDEARLGIAPGSLYDFESWSRRVVPEDLAATQATIADAAERKLDQFRFNYRLRDDAGALRAIEGAARCFYDARGNLTKTAGVTLDVTERARHEATVRDRDAQLQSIFEAIPIAMLVIDGNGKIRHVSPAAERLFGGLAIDLVGSDAATLIPDSAREHLESYIEQRRRGSELFDANVHHELSARHCSGRMFPIELSVGEATVAGERLFTAFIRDLSGQHEAEQTTKDLRDELAQVGRVATMGDMAGSLAHELNQPLSATANFLAATVLLVERGGDRDKVAELVALANEQIQRAGSIIRNIREFIVKRDVEMGIEPVEKTIRDSVAFVLAGAARADVEVRYAFEQSGAFIFCDRVQIQQVMVNLLRNATEALQGQPKHRRTILVGARERPADMIEISVSDTGPGIDARVLEKIFTPLASTKGKDGMGLGLSICRRIVEAHGGTLTAENRSAGGATFRFTLPSGSLDLPEE